MDDEFAHRPPVNEVIKGGQFLQLQGSQAQDCGGLQQALVAQVAVVLLDLVHDVNGLLPGVFGPLDLGLQLFSQFLWDHKLLSVWPFPKIPLNPPLKKGDFHSRALFPPFLEGG